MKPVCRATLEQPGKYRRLPRIIVVAAALLFSCSVAQAQSLAAPTTLHATTYSKSQINLVWNDPNLGLSGAEESGYIVERRGTLIGWSKVFTSGRDVTHWSSTGLSMATTYSYRVRAFLVAGVGQAIYSGYSPVASATTQSTIYANPPTVSITGPASGTLYTAAQPVTITASVSASVGVSRVEFYDGGTLKGMGTAPPFAYTWAVTSAANGTHNWSAKAYDTSNQNSM